MTTHYYSEKEREKHLQNLIEVIEALLPEIEQSGHYIDSLAAYTNACLAAKQLLAEGFVQEDLSKLSRSIPRLFWLHKEWSPPLEPDPSGGTFVEPLWFQRLEPLESKVAAAAEKLRVIGEY